MQRVESVQRAIAITSSMASTWSSSVTGVSGLFSVEKLTFLLEPAFIFSNRSSVSLSTVKYSSSVSLSSLPAFLCKDFASSPIRSKRLVNSFRLFGS